MKSRREVCERMQLDSDDTFHEKVSNIEDIVMKLSPQSLANLDTSVLHANCGQTVSVLELQKQTFHV
jgi:hypothetical protein